MSERAPISYAWDAEGVFYLQLRGELRLGMCCSLDSLIETVFEAQPLRVRAVVIDLTHASFMDSTMIGLLAGVARELKRLGLPRATVFSTHPEINQLLSCLCLEEVFTVVHQSTDQAMDLGLLATTQMQGADAGPESERHTAQVILKAHEALIGVNEANRPVFQSVVELFREQLNEDGRG